MKSKLYILGLICAATACTRIPDKISDVGGMPPIYPDYIGVTVPDNIADLKFKMADGREFLSETTKSGDTLWTTVTAWEKDSDAAVRYQPFPMYVSHDEIDPYIAYRLIEPGYENWHDMGLYQRELSSYKETAIVTNQVNNRGCVNCHTFHQGNPDRFLFHARGTGGGTVFIDGDNVKLLNLTKIGTQKQGVYPAWHPDGRYVAFASCKTYQEFLIKGTQPIEVFDLYSDIIIMDMQTDSTWCVPGLSENNCLETFPTWSPDGSTLYCCSADCDTVASDDWTKKHYELKAIDFKNGKFIGEPRTVWSQDSASISFPRINGNWLLFTKSAYGTFPIWHREADLYLMNLLTGDVFPADELNSPETESYHSWSTNGRWVLFSSRRDDGRYTRLYIAHFDGEGHFGKPFMLPQENPDFNQWRLQSYNVPDFIKGEVPDRQQKIKALFR